MEAARIVLIQSPRPQEWLNPKNLSDSGSKASKWVSMLTSTSQLFKKGIKVGGVTPHAYERVDLTYAAAHTTISCLGIVSQWAGHQVVESTRINKKIVGDKSGQQLAAIGKPRAALRMCQSMVTTTGAIGAYTGLNPLVGRVLQASGSLFSSVGLVLSIGVTYMRYKYLNEMLRILKKEGGFEELRSKMTKLTQEEKEAVDAFQSKKMQGPTNEQLSGFWKRGIVPPAILGEPGVTLEKLEKVELFMIGKREHYGRFIGANNVAKILDGDYKDVGKSIDKIIQSNKTTLKIIALLTIISIGVIITANVLTAGVSELVIPVINLALSFGWLIMDFTFFVKDYRAGKYTKDQMVAYCIAQLAVMALAIGSTIITPFSSLIIQASLVGVIFCAIGYNIVRTIQQAKKAASLPKLEAKSDRFANKKKIRHLPTSPKPFRQKELPNAYKALQALS